MVGVTKLPLKAVLYLFLGVYRQMLTDTEG